MSFFLSFAVVGVVVGFGAWHMFQNVMPPNEHLMPSSDDNKKEALVANRQPQDLGKSVTSLQTKVTRDNVSTNPYANHYEF